MSLRARAKLGFQGPLHMRTAVYGSWGSGQCMRELEGAGADIEARSYGLVQALWPAMCD